MSIKFIIKTRVIYFIVLFIVNEISSLKIYKSVIKKDVIRMSTVNDAILRFVFYYSQEDFSGLQSLKDKYPNVQIIPITFMY